MAGGSGGTDAAYSQYINGNKDSKHYEGRNFEFRVSQSADFEIYGNSFITGSLTVGATSSFTDTRGRIDATNDVIAYSTSDENFKDNITPIKGSLDKIMQISGVEFDWKPLTEEQKVWLHGNAGHDVGVIAQEIEKVLPEVVTTRESGFKAVRYEKIIPLLIEAIKEQQKQIDSLKNE